MNKQFALAALGALGLLIGCGDGGTTTTTTGSGGSTSSATGTGGAGGTVATTTISSSGSSMETSTATSTSTSSGAGGGGPGAACTACVGMKEVFKPGTACATSLEKCNADADCDSWFKCVQNCEASTYTTACFAACDQSAASVKTLYQPIYACSCGACKAECSVACP